MRYHKHRDLLCENHCIVKSKEKNINEKCKRYRKIFLCKETKYQAFEEDS